MLLLQEVILKPENLKKYALKFWSSSETSFAPAVTGTYIYFLPSILLSLWHYSEDTE